jgi:hypothetical protein
MIAILFSTMVLIAFGLYVSIIVNERSASCALARIKAEVGLDVTNGWLTGADAGNAHATCPVVMFHRLKSMFGVFPDVLTYGKAGHAVWQRMMYRGIPLKAVAVSSQYPQFKIGEVDCHGVMRVCSALVEGLPEAGTPEMAKVAAAMAEKLPNASFCQATGTVSVLGDDMSTIVVTLTAANRVATAFGTPEELDKIDLVAELAAVRVGPDVTPDVARERLFEHEQALLPARKTKA